MAFKETYTQRVGNGGERGLLAHEAAFVLGAVDVARTASEVANKAYGETVANSGGDWAFDDDSSRAAAELAEGKERDYKKLQGLLKVYEHAGVLPYPDADDPKTTYGSRVTIKLPRFTDVCDITSRNIPGLEAPDEDIVLLSPDSPMGAALIGKQAGEEASWTTPDNRVFTGTVIGVDQTAQQQSYPGLEVTN